MRKKILHSIHACILFMLILPVSTQAAEEIIVDSETLNVRDGKGIEFDLLGTIYQNEIYPITQKSEEWIEIDYEQQSGWVSKEYVTIESSQADNQTSSDEVSLDTFTTPIDNMYIRTEPSPASSIQALFEQGTTCSIVEEATDTWYLVICGDEEGYMLQEHLTAASMQENESIQGKTIVIDAGHGGRDVGSIGVNGVYEKDLTLQTALALEEALNSLGVNVHMTRDGDTYEFLKSRVLYANVLHADAFLSIHYNSFPEVPSVTGIGTYYYEGADQILAAYLQNAVSTYSGKRNRGIDFGDYQVLRNNKRPSALIELGFLSNEESEQLLQTDAYQDKLIHGIVNGLSEFFADQ